MEAETIPVELTGALDDTLRGGSIALGPEDADESPAEAAWGPSHLHNKTTQDQ